MQNVYDPKPIKIQVHKTKWNNNFTAHWKSNIAITLPSFVKTAQQEENIKGTIFGGEFYKIIWCLNMKMSATNSKNLEKEYQKTLTKQNCMNSVHWTQ